jgi:hypothetical protein
MPLIASSQKWVTLTVIFGLVDCDSRAAKTFDTNHFIQDNNFPLPE